MQISAIFEVFDEKKSCQHHIWIDGACQEDVCFALVIALGNAAEMFVFVCILTWMQCSLIKLLKYFSDERH